MDFGTAIIWMQGNLVHFEIFVEDQSGKQALDILVQKIIEISKHTFRVIAYKGIGRIPKDIGAKADVSKRPCLSSFRVC